MTREEQIERDQEELVGLYFMLAAITEKVDNIAYSSNIISGNLKRKANMFAEEVIKIDKLIGNLMFNEEPELTVDMTELCGEIVRDIFGGRGIQGVPLDKLPELRDVIQQFKAEIKENEKTLDLD